MQASGVGFLFRRNVLFALMSIEIMLNAVNLALVAFSKFNKIVDGQVFVFFIIAIAVLLVVAAAFLIWWIWRRAIRETRRS